MYLPAMGYAIGSSYLIRQTAGSERFGGVTVKIGPQAMGTDSLTVVASDWLTDEPIDGDIQFLIDGATEGGGAVCG
ncbi:MAG: hypothetical protein AAF268_10485 [Cyanobacteria bacterium P01_A01_bin.3]